MRRSRAHRSASEVAGGGAQKGRPANAPPRAFQGRSGAPRALAERRSVWALLIKIRPFRICWLSAICSLAKRRPYGLHLWGCIQGEGARGRLPQRSRNPRGAAREATPWQAMMLPRRPAQLYGHGRRVAGAPRAPWRRRGGALPARPGGAGWGLGARAMVIQPPSVVVTTGHAGWRQRPGGSGRTGGCHSVSSLKISTKRSAVSGCGYYTHK